MTTAMFLKVFNFALKTENEWNKLVSLEGGHSLQTTNPPSTTDSF